MIGFTFLFRVSPVTKTVTVFEMYSQNRNKNPIMFIPYNMIGFTFLFWASRPEKIAKKASTPHATGFHSLSLATARFN